MTCSIAPQSDSQVEVSVVMPCLNEEQTIGVCIEKALEAFRRHNINGEIIVCDNGSTDRSVEIARSLGARVVHQPARGYGNAYLKGFAEAKGKYFIMGDSDDTYDFSEIDRFRNALREGYDFVSGNRFQGRILPGAMPWLHRYFGNHLLTFLLNLFFRTGFKDVYCGMRAFTREAYEKIRPVSTGMEFNLELAMRAAKARIRMTEIPITLHPRAGTRKLRTFRDGWRSVRFMLLYSPTYVFLVPGGLLSFLGIIGTIWLAIAPPVIFGHELGIIFSVFFSMLALLGYQLGTVGLCARTYSLTEKFEQNDRFLEVFYRHFQLEKGILLGLAMALVGLGVDIYILYRWIVGNFGPLYLDKVAVAALTLVVAGVQTIFFSFFISAMSLKKRIIPPLKPGGEQN